MQDGPGNPLGGNMEIKLTKEYSVDEMERLLEDYNEKYGSIYRLKNHIQEEGCQEYETMDDMMIWLTIVKNLQNINLPQDIPFDKTLKLEFKQTITYPNFDLTDFITPKRMELLQTIKRHPGMSIKEIALFLNRDYKNIYDDIQALVQFDLLTLQKKGKSKIQIYPLDAIEIMI
jgi:hypothetical protein